ncbi:MAG: GspH/FimT family pseudopilin [Proteobacteria bacterium]|nr:GspH/FimT family pseudopilin [Pseudomonadota bacterium]
MPESFANRIDIGRDAARINGFTLIELLIVLAIVAILGSFSSSFAALIARQEISAQTNEVVASLKLARTVAIVRQTRVTLCQSTSGSECERGTDWGKGWILFTDADNNRAIDPGDDVIQVHPGLNNRTSLFWRGSLGTNYYLSFLASGFSNKAGSFWVCSDTSVLNEARRVVVARTGRVRTSDATNSEIMQRCN